MRRGAYPTRRDGRFFTLFQAKREKSAVAMARWRPNATWRGAQITSKPQPYRLPLRCG